MGFGVFLGGVSLVGFLATVEFVESFNDDENSEGHDKKVDDVLDKVAVSDVRNGVGTKNIRDINSKGRKISATSE